MRVRQNPSRSTRRRRIRTGRGRRSWRRRDKKIYGAFEYQTLQREDVLEVHLKLLLVNDFLAVDFAKLGNQREQHRGDFGHARSSLRMHEVTALSFANRGD